MRDPWLSRVMGYVWDLEAKLNRLRLRVSGVCPDCYHANQVHPVSCPRQGAPAKMRRL